MRLIFNALLLGTALITFAPFGAAQTTAQTQAKPAAKAQPKAKTQKKSTKNDKDASSTEDDKDVDLAASTPIEVECAHGDKITLYRNASDNSHIGMRWKKRLMRMHRVETTTGADRFESHRHGLVWIGIPAKGMLLDTKKGQQLANECRSAEQIAAQAAQTQPAPPQLLIEARR